MKIISLIVVLVICVIVFREKPLEDPLLLMPDRETTGTSASPTATCDITGGTIDGVEITPYNGEIDSLDILHED